MFNKILVGLDGSPRQAAVLRQAVELADRCGGRLHLVRAMQIPVSIPALAWSLQGDDFSKFLVEHGQRDLAAIEAELPAGLVEHRWCELAQPADLLCRLATDVGADLVVIGSHGYDRIDRLLGTTAAKVVNRSPCSVIVVREPENL
jgi:nucleotide-binding universal stress UspA family protein